MLLFTGISIASYAQSGLDILKAMEKKNAGIQSVQGSLVQFQQERGQAAKQTPAQFKMQKQPVAVRYDLSGTAPSTHLIYDNKAYTYVPALKQVSITKLNNAANQPELALLLLGFDTKAETIAKQYNISALSGGIGVHLASKTQKVAYTIEIDQNSMLPVRLRKTDQMGTITGVDITPSSLSFNTVNPAEFTPNFPKGIHTVETN